MNQYCLYPFETFTEEEYMDSFGDFLFRKEEVQTNIIKILLKEDETKHYGLHVK